MSDYQQSDTWRSNYWCPCPIAPKPESRSQTPGSAIGPKGPFSPAERLRGPFEVGFLRVPDGSIEAVRSEWFGAVEGQVARKGSSGCRDTAWADVVFLFWATSLVTIRVFGDSGFILHFRRSTRKSGLVVYPSVEFSHPHHGPSLDVAFHEVFPPMQSASKSGHFGRGRVSFLVDQIIVKEPACPPERHARRCRCQELDENGGSKDSRPPFGWFFLWAPYETEKRGSEPQEPRQSCCREINDEKASSF